MPITINDYQRDRKMSKPSTTPLTDSIIQNIFIDRNEVNNNHIKCDNALTEKGKLANGLPGLFTEIDMNGTHGLTGRYFENDLKRPYSLYDGKSVSNIAAEGIHKPI